MFFLNKKIFVVVILLTILALGCVNTVTTKGVGTYSYVDGTLRHNIDATVLKTYNASIKALRQLGLPIYDRNSDAIVAYVKSGFADGKDIMINIESVANSLSKISIHIGIIGDEYRAMRVLSQIEKNI